MPVCPLVTGGDLQHSGNCWRGASTGQGSRRAGGGGLAAATESSPAECQDLIQALLQLRPHARLDLQQAARHRGMQPTAHSLFCTILSTLPGGAGPWGWASGLSLSAQTEPPMRSTVENPGEPREDAEPPRSLLQLHHPQQLGAPKSASGPAPEPPDASPSAGGDSARLGLRSTAMANLGVGASRQPPPLCSGAPSRMCWGSARSTEGRRVGRVEVR